MTVSARDKKSLLMLLEQAQLVYLLTRLPKKQVLDDPRDVARLEEGLAGMREAARDLSASLRQTTPPFSGTSLQRSPTAPISSGGAQSVSGRRCCA